MTLGALYQDIAVARGHIEQVLRRLALRHRIQGPDLDHAIEGHLDAILTELLIHKVKRELEPETKRRRRVAGGGQV